eukprot:COSAG05_NODE_1054_length_6012_cov_63.809572_1_plen_83_part_10
MDSQEAGTAYGLAGGVWTRLDCDGSLLYRMPSLSSDAPVTGLYLTLFARNVVALRMDSQEAGTAYGLAGGVWTRLDCDGSLLY